MNINEKYNINIKEEKGNENIKYNNIIKKIINLKEYEKRRNNVEAIITEDNENIMNKN